MDVCVVCFNNTRTKTFCVTDTDEFVNHPICKKCANVWIPRHGTCPTCRQLVVSLSRTQGIFVRPSMIHAGITLKNSKHGVLITECKQFDGAYKCGLRAGMIIRKINGILATEHSNVLAIISYCFKHGKDMYIDVMHPTPKQSKIYKCALRCGYIANIVRLFQCQNPYVSTNTETVSRVVSSF